MKLYGSVFLTLCALVACDADDSATVETWWVGPERVECTGVGLQECYQVQYGEQPTDDWEFFYDGVAGFDEQYEAGYLYQIQLQKKEVPNPPADGSSYVYSLVKILSKQSAL